jgi:hypothetical protein
VYALSQSDQAIAYNLYLRVRSGDQSILMNYWLIDWLFQGLINGRFYPQFYGLFFELFFKEFFCLGRLALLNSICSLQLLLLFS